MPRKQKQPRQPDQQRPDAGPGAGDASSGGGAGSGIPGGGTDIRTGRAIPTSDVEKDRAKLFPEAKTRRNDPPAS